jgi:hypothetical protein
VHDAREQLLCPQPVADGAGPFITFTLIASPLAGELRQPQPALTDQITIQ